MSARVLYVSLLVPYIPSDVCLHWVSLFKGITVPIPSAILPFLRSTFAHSRTTSPTSTPTVTPNAPPSSEQNIASIAGAVSGVIVAIILISTVAFVCWIRRRRRGYNDTPPQGVHRWGIRGRIVDWRSGGTLSRADTVSSWFAGREEKEETSKGLLSRDLQRVLRPQQSNDPGIEYTNGGAGETTPTRSEHQMTPPPPPPTYLKPHASMSVREDWMRRTSSPAPPSSFSNPFATPPHSRASSYDLPDRYPDRASTTSNLLSAFVSISPPFSVVKSFLGSDGNTPPSSSSSPGILQEKQLELATREYKVATESNVPYTPANAIAAAPDSAFDPLSPGKASSDLGHRRNLTIDTTNLGVSRPVSRRTLGITTDASGVPVDPKKDSAPSSLHHSIPNDNNNSNSDEGAAASAELQKMFRCSTPVSDYEVHESTCGRFQTTPTEGCHELLSPAAPESATTEAFGIGFGAMGGKWDPRHSDPNRSSNDGSVAAQLSSKKSKKMMKTPPGPVKTQSSIQRVSSFLSTSISASHEGESFPEETGTIMEVDENAPPLLGTYLSDGSAPTSAPSTGGGTPGNGGAHLQEPAQNREQGRGSPLTPRTAPPRHSVAPEDFSEEGLKLSRENTRW